MITTRTTALMVAMALVGATPLAAFAGGDEEENSNSIKVTDDDEVTQTNTAAIVQTQSSSSDGSVNVGNQPQTNVAVGVIGQSNTNEDNDVQTVIASQEIDDSETETNCAALAGLIGFNVCGNEEDLND